MRILYTDDEEDMRTIVQFALEGTADLDLRVCASGQEAIDLLSGSSPDHPGTDAGWQPDLILLDVTMPDMDGPTTLRGIRALSGMADIPVAFLTGKLWPEEIAAFKAMGAVEVIAKPFDPMTLADKLLAIRRSVAHE